MTEIKGIPYAQVKFDKDGKRQTLRMHCRHHRLDCRLPWLEQHGGCSAGTLQKTVRKLFQSDQERSCLQDRKVAIAGVIWPAKKFDDLMTQLSGSAGRDTGGAKSLGAADPAAAEAAMHEAIDRAAPAFDDPGTTSALQSCTLWSRRLRRARRTKPPSSRRCASCSIRTVRALGSSTRKTALTSSSRPAATGLRECHEPPPASASSCGAASAGQRELRPSPRFRRRLLLKSRECSDKPSQPIDLLRDEAARRDRRQKRCRAAHRRARRQGE